MMIEQNFFYAVDLIKIPRVKLGIVSPNFGDGL